jgi:predicted O-methyltransferase YrrM
MRPELLDLPRGWPHHIVKIADLLDEHRPLVCVELGTYCGASAIAIARMIRPWGGRLTCVDTWAAGPTPGYPSMMMECVDNMIKAGIMASVSLVPATTVDVALHWVGGVDFLYVDAGHYYEEVLADLEAWWPKLEVGGLICGDDYDLPGWDGVKQAWDEFEQKYDQKFEKFATENTEPPGMKLVWGVKR